MQVEVASLDFETIVAYSDIPGKGDVYKDGEPPSVAAIDRDMHSMPLTDYCRIDVKYDDKRGPIAVYTYGIDKETKPNFSVVNRGSGYEDFFSAFVSMSKGDKGEANRTLCSAVKRDMPLPTVLPRKDVQCTVQKKIGKAEHMLLESSYFKAVYSQERIISVNPTDKFVAKMKQHGYVIDIYLSDEQEGVNSRCESLNARVDFLNYPGKVYVASRSEIRDLNAVLLLQNQVDYMLVLNREKIICLEIDPYSPISLDYGVTDIKDDVTTIHFLAGGIVSNTYVKRVGNKVRVPGYFLAQVWRDFPVGFNYYLPYKMTEKGYIGEYCAPVLKARVCAYPAYEVFGLDVDVSSVQERSFGGVNALVASHSETGKDVIVCLCDSRSVYDQLSDIVRLSMSQKYRFSWRKGRHGTLYVYPNSPLLAMPLDEVKDSLVYGCKARFKKLTDSELKMKSSVVMRDGSIRYKGLFGKKGEQVYIFDPKGDRIFRFIGITLPGCPQDDRGNSLMGPQPIWSALTGNITNSGANKVCYYDLPHETPSRLIDLIEIQEENRVFSSPAREKLMKVDRRILELRRAGEYGRFPIDVVGCSLSDVQDIERKKKVNIVFVDGVSYVEV